MRRLVLSATFVLLSVATPAEAPAASPPVHRLPELHVVDIMPVESERAPAAASILNAETIARLRPLTLHDALRFLPGVRTIDDDVSGRRSGISVRGAPARRSRKVLLLEDGTPINAATYLDPSAHYTPPMERLARVEVLKGSGHVRHGPINNHGILNFRSVGPTTRPETVLELAAGNFDTFKRHVRHTRTDGRLGTVLSYTGFRADGVFDVEDTRFEDFHGSVRWAGPEGDELRLAATFFHERSHYDESNLTPQEYAIAPRVKRGRFGQEFNTFALNHWKLDLVHRKRLHENWTLASKLFATEFDRPRFTVEPGDTPVGELPRITPSEPFDATLGLGQMISRDRAYRTFGAELQVTHRRSAGERDQRLAHEWQVGLRVERQRLSDRRTAGEPGEVLHESNRGVRTRDEAYIGEAASVFLLDQMQWDQWTLTPGVRVERYTQSKQRHALPADPGPHVPRMEDRTTLALPAVTLLHDSDTTQVFASIGRGYTPAFARTAVGFPLEPETGINTQIGVRRQPAPGIAFEVSLFNNRIRNTVVQMPFTLDQRDIYLNSEDSVSRGFDLWLEGRRKADRAGGLRPFAELAYGYVDARFTRGLVDGKRVPEVPRHAGNLTLGVERGAWEASVTLSHFGGFYTDPANTRELTLADEDGALLGPDDQIEIREPVVFGYVPSHALLSARISWARGSTGPVFWLQGRNLTNRLYLADLQNGARPGAARTITGGVTLRF